MQSELTLLQRIDTPAVSPVRGRLIISTSINLNKKIVKNYITFSRKRYLSYLYFETLSITIEQLFAPKIISFFSRQAYKLNHFEMINLRKKYLYYPIRQTENDFTIKLMEL